MNIVDVLKGLVELEGNVTLAVKDMYLNEIPFLMSRAIYFRTAETITISL